MCYKRLQSILYLNLLHPLAKLYGLTKKAGTVLFRNLETCGLKKWEIVKDKGGAQFFFFLNATTCS